MRTFSHLGRHYSDAGHFILTALWAFDLFTVGGRHVRQHKEEEEEEEEEEWLTRKKERKKENDNSSLVNVNVMK